MCVAVPGVVVSVDRTGVVPIAEVDFGGVTRHINMSFVPDAEPGDRLITHSGLAVRIARTDVWDPATELSG
ncbi:MAG: HypC/HybG/HupF family hydrogenase formation chaperone [Acidimicrobiia bacterium]|nr:HypC/HybG/HupF family hydrogenase formation chaperone [Acidimicrobiia bacterium]MBT8213684.1 HypC/HybG/HupF family hydrogenase formation chaperone [Acidimicrobiia bacterium]NNF68540.1 HypC/HybG/HupF family hydrogenase formation chaperone [Acidimicrobiia bacterium]NNK91047.1 HypC/HybG/HupF family hydrogenase formation chaperone [Acidimicrobiia bacterium]